MNDLVIVNSKKEAVASHVIIAEGMKVTQDAALKLIKSYKSDLEEFGRVRFQIVPFKTKGGVQNRKEFMLNRDQRKASLLDLFKEIRGLFEMTPMLPEQEPGGKLRIV